MSKVKILFIRTFCVLLVFVLSFGFVSCSKDTPAETEPSTEIITITQTEPSTEASTSAPSLPAHAEGSWPYLSRFMPSGEFGVAQYSTDEIRSMKDYSASELQAAISTIPDMIQYIVENNYGDDAQFSGDLTFIYNNYVWSVNKSPQGALLSQNPSCGAIANLVRFVLEDDYDEEGYIHWKDFFAKTRITGGHVVNYFKQGDTYLVLDFTRVINNDLDAGCFWYVKSLEDIVPKILQKSNNPSQEKFVRWAIFVERDVHRDHVPAAAINTETGKFVCIIDSSFSYEIEFLHLDEEWLNGLGSKWIDYREPFQDGGVTSSMVPAELVDSADMTYYDGPITPETSPTEDAV